MKRRLVRAELLKCQSTRIPFWSLVALAVSVLLFALLPLWSSEVGPSGRPIIEDAARQRGVLAGGSFAGSIALVVGIMLSAGEYRHKTILATFLGTPHRRRVLVAKAISCSIVGALLGVVGTALTLAIALPLIVRRGAELQLSLSQLAALAAGGIVYSALSGVLGVGLGIVIRSQVVAVVVAVAALFVVEPLILGALPEVGRWLPSNAGRSLSAAAPLMALPAGVAALVYSAYVGVAVGAASIAIARDVAGD